MVTKINDIASDIAKKLEKYNAEVSYSPSFELRGMSDRRVVVVPVGEEVTFQSRTSKKCIYKLQIGIIRKCKSKEEIPALVSLTESIGKPFLGEECGGCVCASLKYDPLYAVEEVRRNNLFISVIEVSFVSFMI